MFKDFNPSASFRRKTTTAMPGGWKNPLRTPLYQVVVQPTPLAVAEGIHPNRPIPVGPAILMEYADEFCAAIRDKIKRGDERYWSDPTVVLVRALPGLA